jgi:hypothetical protein
VCEILVKQEQRQAQLQRTMASNEKIPPELKVILSEWSKSVILSKPKDLMLFSAE